VGFVEGQVLVIVSSETLNKENHFLLYFHRYNVSEQIAKQRRPHLWWYVSC
jgi:hypothetical protein